MNPTLLFVLGALGLVALWAALRARSVTSLQGPQPAAPTQATDAPETPPPTLYFDVHGPDGTSRQSALTQRVIKLGSDPKAHLRVQGARVFRMHAVIEAEPNGRVVLIDLGTPQGTLHNGQKIHRAELTHGDTVTLGELRITVGINAVVPTAAVQNAA